MAGGLFTVDGVSYNVTVPAGGLQRNFKVLDGENAGRMLGGSMTRDINGNRTFNADSIESVNIHQAASLISMRLEADTLTAVVKTTDKTITSFTKNTPLLYYCNDVLKFRAYIQSVDREGPDRYRLTGTSAIGLLIDRGHAGGIYTGQTAQAVLQEICGSVAFSLKSTFRSVRLYGWLPYAKPPERSARDNLCQVLFALGCTVKTDANGTLQIAPLSNTVMGTITQDQIYSGARVKYEGPVSAVTVTEHQYMMGIEEETLYEGSTNANDIIIFSEPMYGLKANGFNILASNANYARVSLGTGTLTGRKYIHNTRQITRTVTAGAAENVKTISDATLISVVNSNSAAERMAAYYKCLETIQCGIVMDTQAAGEMRNVYHPYNKNTIKTCLESLDITSGASILRADINALVGYTPPKYTQNLDLHLVITSSGNVTLPDGVTRVRAVLIGGGNGGDGGENGTAGTAGATSSASSSSKLVINKGAGGNGGKGGKGGKVATYEITGASIKTISVSIGPGGAGGASNAGKGSAGGNTTLTINGTTYSSASGTSNAAGYQDVVDGKIYGKPGGIGKDGADGGKGGSPTTSEGVPGEDGSSTAYSGGTGGTGGHTGSGSSYATGTGGGGGGGASGSDHGGNGGNGAGTRGGAGGTGGEGSSTMELQPPAGSGGYGGDGGGGGGGGGGTVAAAAGGNSITVVGGTAGPGGPGGGGGPGTSGCVILFYGYPQTIE